MNDDVLSGIEARMLYEKDPLKVEYVANKKAITSQSGIKLHNDEHILKIVMDYDDRAIRGIRLSTDQQLISLGPCYESDYFVECDKSETDSAIIGFQLAFGSDRIVEVSVFSAPLFKNLEFMQRSSKTLQLDRFASQLSLKKSGKKLDGLQDNLKSTFKLYRQLKKNNSY